MASAKSVILSGGARAGNIFWQVAGGVGVDIGTTSHFEGTILSQAGINMQTGASINGRLLAQTAVTLQSNAVTEPTDSSKAMALRSADTVSGLYTYTPGQYINFAKKSITAPKQGNIQFYQIWSDTALTITEFTATNGNVAVTYE